MLATFNLSRFAIALIAVHVLTLALTFGKSPGFLVGADGHPHPIEFVGVRAAGELVREGKAAAAYDWATHGAQHRAVTGQTDDTYYPWPYPPPYLAVAALLALLPYLASALTWVAATLALQAWSLLRIARTPHAVLWLLAAPVTVVNAKVAHTGYLSAALFGLGLMWLTRTPLAAGVAFGLLAFKPQLGLLVAVALAAGGHWRTIGAATATILVACLASVLAFGVEPWPAFVEQLGRITDIFRFERTNMAMLVSTYGLARTLGLGHTAALVPQALVTLAAAGAIVWLWRSDRVCELKAAGLVSASLMASPYLYIYDLPLLVTGLVFLWRAKADVGFDEHEVYAIAVLGLVTFAYAVTPVPAGVIANAIAAWLVIRRVRMATGEPAFTPAPRVL